MSTKTLQFGTNMRVIGAITTKDILDAIRNKTTLTSMLSILFMIVFYRYMPTLTASYDPTTVRVYSESESLILEELNYARDYRVRSYSSLETMQEILRGRDWPELGLIIPAGFDEALAAGETPVLQAYILNWVSEEDAAELVDEFRQNFYTETGYDVNVNLENSTIYMEKKSPGIGFLSSIAYIFAITMIGISVIPHLMIAEKEAKTLDALLVSPAGPFQVVLSKALTGLFYAAALAAVIIAFFANIVLHWEVLLLGLLGFSLLMVGIGLLLGSVLEVKQQIMVWGWVVIIPMLIPVFLQIMVDIMPAWLIQVFEWVPTVAVSNIIRVAYMEAAPLSLYGRELAYVFAWAAAVLAATVFFVRRSDR